MSPIPFVLDRPNSPLADENGQIEIEIDGFIEEGEAPTFDCPGSLPYFVPTTIRTVNGIEMDPDDTLTDDELEDAEALAFAQMREYETA